MWRLCKTLEHEGYLISDPTNAKFRPGLAVLTLGYAALNTLDIAELARPFLQKVSSAHHGAAGLSSVERTTMLYLQRIEATNSFLNVNLRVGSTVPIISSGTGWGYLAGLTKQQRTSKLAELKKLDPDRYAAAEKPLLKALASFTDDGFVSNVDVFYHGLATVSVPIVIEGTTAYVLNCTSPTAALSTRSAQQAAGADLMAAAEQLGPVIARTRSRG